MVLPNMTSVMRSVYSYALHVGRNYRLCKVQSSYVFGPTQIASISGKTMRADRPPRPPPFDWKNKEYGWWQVLTDPIEERFDDNSKIVIVDGLPAVGKDKFAKRLADELDMLYVPQPRFDDIFINAYGFDYRSINDQLPIDARFFDDKMFLADPYNRNTTLMQHTFYIMRFRQYIDALIHVFSTGQGVVLQRSPWSDMVFMKAMHKFGYISEGGCQYYKCSAAATLFRLLKPHLVIYLDVPSSIVKQRIQKRALPHEINSAVLTLEYLNEIENSYKNLHLPDISTHAHLLIYNWIEEGDMSWIVDDIERLQFCDHGEGSPIQTDWKFATVDEKRGARGLYANCKEQLLRAAVIARYDVPEMVISSDDASKLQEVFTKLDEEGPGHKYAPGFDPDLDKGVLWKTRHYQ